jgi:hypothetical protein
MKKNRLIFYSIFAFFQLAIFLFTVYMDVEKENLDLLFALLRKIWMLKYGALIGLLLLAVDVIWFMKSEREHRKEKALVQTEMNNLKAKLFDLQEAAAKKQNTPLEGKPL